MAVEEPTVSSKVVHGRRVSLWEQFRKSPGEKTWTYASIPAFILAVVKLVFFYSDLSFGATAFYIALGLVAGAGLIALSTDRRSRPIESECPVCGERVWFALTRLNIEKETPVALCEKCLAYVALQDGEIREAPLETVSDRQGFWIDYRLYKDRYRPKDGIKFTMPPFCAICGSHEVVEQLPIRIIYENKSGDNALWREFAYANGKSYYKAGSAVPDRLSGADLADLRTPACAQHGKHNIRCPDPATGFDDGTLTFASYRYYKAFCAVNHIVPYGTQSLPTARVR